MRTIFSSFIIASALFLPFSVHASGDTTPCACFCKGSGGADQISAGTDSAPTADSTTDACSDACQAKGETKLGCYKDDQSSGLPTNNLMCWSEYECTTQVSTDPNTSGLTYDWGGQDSSCPSGEGECYAPSTPVTLGVVIDDMATAQDLPSYIAAVYNWLIPAGALVAVVMIMIGGLQYVMARGEPKGIGAAKTRITHAVEGMLLLMVSYALLNLIDPGLVTLQTLRIPQVRRVVYLDPSSTCEYMMANGLTITAAGDTSCGNQGTISSIDGWVGGGVPTVVVGDTCQYSACSDALATCVSSASATNGYACIRCANTANDAAGLTFDGVSTPSQATCSALKRSDSGVADEHQYCEYYDAYAGGVTEADSCVEIVYPAADDVTSLDCARLRDDARVGDSESCRIYDNVWAIANMVPNTSVGMYSNELDDKLGADDTYPLLKTICEADPCGLAPPGDTCKASVIESGPLNTVCSIPGMDAFPLCGLLSSGTRGDCVNGAFYDSLQIFLYSTSPTEIYDAYQLLEIKDLNGTAVDFNPTW